MSKLTIALALASAIMPVVVSAAPAYSVAGAISGPDGGWDYARVDAAARKLYVARGTSVTVVDLKTMKTVGSLGAIAHGHAVVPLWGGRLLATSGDDASVRFLRAGDGAELARLAVGRKPDAAIVSADGSTAYVMNATDGTVSVIDVAAMRVTRTITVKPALEYAALTPDGTLFINDEDANEMEVVDLAAGKAAAPIPLPGCDAPSGLAYDGKTDRLIAACANGKTAIVDAKRRRLAYLLDTGMGPDAVIIDPVRRLAFIPAGKDGVLDILSLDGPKIAVAGRVKTEIGARTGALDPVTGAIYLPTAKFAPPPADGKRPAALPGTFHVVVVRPIAG